MGVKCDERELHNFNPLAPCGARPDPVDAFPANMHFNPLAPCGARLGLAKKLLEADNFNPLAPCGARPRVKGAGRK